MTINVLFIIVAMALIGKMAQGFKRGMVKEVISFVSLVILCIVIAILSYGLKSYLGHETVSVIVMVILLLVVIVVHSFISIFFFTAKVVSRLPVVSSLNKVLGLLVGGLELLVMIWLIYYFSMIMDLGSVGAWLKESTAENSVLEWIYRHNYLAVILNQFGAETIMSIF